MAFTPLPVCRHSSRPPGEGVTDSFKGLVPLDGVLSQSKEIIQTPSYSKCGLSDTAL